MPQCAATVFGVYVYTGTRLCIFLCGIPVCYVLCTMYHVCTCCMHDVVVLPDTERGERLELQEENHSIAIV